MSRENARPPRDAEIVEDLHGQVEERTLRRDETTLVATWSTTTEISSGVFAAAYGSQFLE